MKLFFLCVSINALQLQNSVRNSRGHGLDLSIDQTRSALLPSSDKEEGEKGVKRKYHLE